MNAGRKTVATPRVNVSLVGHEGAVIEAHLKTLPERGASRRLLGLAYFGLLAERGAGSVPRAVERRPAVLMSAVEEAAAPSGWDDDIGNAAAAFSGD